MEMKLERRPTSDDKVSKFDANGKLKCGAAIGAKFFSSSLASQFV